jgi:asparagine synthase (glutamine-hydrolysing)
MTVIGYLKKSSHKSILTLGNDSYRSIIKNKGFSCYSNFRESERNYVYSFKNDVHLILVGTITNVDYENDDKENTLQSIIENYLIKRIKSFDDLDGSYVLILWDGKKEILHINRDVYGTKLLYYHISSTGEVVFSNNVDILLKITGRRDIEHKSLHEYLRFLDVSPPFTFFKDIHILETEKLLISDGSKFQLLNLDTQLSHSNGGNATLEHSVGEFSNLLCKSICKMIKDAGRVGVFLSGGIDSSLLCSLTAKVAGNIRAFTVGFEDSEYDESDIDEGRPAEEIAGHIGLKKRLVRFTEKDYVDSVIPVIKSLEQPMGDSAAFPVYLAVSRTCDEFDVYLRDPGVTHIF